MANPHVSTLAPQCISECSLSCLTDITIEEKELRESVLVKCVEQTNTVKGSKLLSACSELKYSMFRSLNI